MTPQSDWSTEAKLLYQVLQQLKKINSSIHSTVTTTTTAV